MKKDPKILIVDDDESNLSLLELLLGRAGYEVIQAGNGQTAIEAVDGSFTIAFIDMHLPDMDGTDVITAVRQAYPSLFIVAATMDDGLTTIKSAYKAGCDMFLVKPYDIASLIPLVENAERGKYWIVDRLGMREYRG
jgi:CheY-like chemotaxis protein